MGQDRETRDEYPLPWRRSARGNLWRVHEGRTVTVFKRDGRYSWCIYDREPRYSPAKYATERAAFEAVQAELGEVAAGSKLDRELDARLAREP